MYVCSAGAILLLHCVVIFLVGVEYWLYLFFFCGFTSPIRYPRLCIRFLMIFHHWISFRQPLLYILLSFLWQYLAVDWPYFDQHLFWFLDVCSCDCCWVLACSSTCVACGHYFLIWPFTLQLNIFALFPTRCSLNCRMIDSAISS